MLTKLLTPRKRLFVIVSVLCLFFVFLVGNAFAAKLPDGKTPPIASDKAVAAYLPGQVIVKFKSGRNVDALSAKKSFALVSSERILYGFTRLYIEGDVLASCKELMKDPSVAIAEPNFVRYATRTPNDPLFFKQTNMKLSNAELGWNIETGDASVIVAVIDTGVDIQHPDLTGNLMPGKNFRESDQNEADDSGHGTAVTGVVAAVGNNSEGVCGAGWRIKVLPLRACGGQSLSCNVVDEAEAMQEAIVQGADIINLSLGGFGKSTIEETAVNDAWAAGITIFAAAGNHGLLGVAGDPETESNINYPAGYDNVVGVSSVDYPANGSPASATLSSFSNSGTAVKVTAVGADVVTTAPSVTVQYPIFSEPAKYGIIDGTSFSTPLVSGLAAVVKSHFPNLTNVELRKRIEIDSVIDIGDAGYDYKYGYGLVDFQKALIGSTRASNDAFNMGVTTSPVLNDDVIVIVKVKSAITGNPTVTYSYTENGSLKTGTVSMKVLPSDSTIWSGRFDTLFSGAITIKVNGIGPGGNLPELQMDYYKGQSN